MKQVGADELVLGDDCEATDLVQARAGSIAGCRGIYAGRLRNSAQVEAPPANLIAILQGGVNDLGDTNMEETTSRMAGSTNGSRMSVLELENNGRPRRTASTRTHRPVRQAA